MYNLYSQFDIQEHKKKYINYLEVIIDKNGKIAYAIPSHQEKLISMACDIYDWNRRELDARCPEEYYFDFMTWLCKITGAIAVWTNHIEFDSVSKKQVARLRELKMNGLYKGLLPEVNIK